MQFILHSSSVIAHHELPSSKACDNDLNATIMRVWG
jgi:hypothetical protein